MNKKVNETKPCWSEYSCFLSSSYWKNPGDTSGQGLRRHGAIFELTTRQDVSFRDWFLQPSFDRQLVRYRRYKLQAQRFNVVFKAQELRFFCSKSLATRVEVGLTSGSRATFLMSPTTQILSVTRMSPMFINRNNVGLYRRWCFK